jgi:hypothetical protein
MAQQFQAVDRPFALLASLAGEILQPPLHGDWQWPAGRYCHFAFRGS